MKKIFATLLAATALFAVAGSYAADEMKKDGMAK